jgi:hypothetical protein
MAEISKITSRDDHAAADSLPWHAAVGAADACFAVTRILQGEPPAIPDGPGEDRAENGVVFLGQLLFAVRLANGINPRADTLPGTGRGTELARQFLANGQVEVCCSHCGSLMLHSVAQVMAALMERLHDRAAISHWQALAAAVGLPDMQHLDSAFPDQERPRGAGKRRRPTECAG